MLLATAYPCCHRQRLTKAATVGPDLETGGLAVGLSVDPAAGLNKAREA